MNVLDEIKGLLATGQAQQAMELLGRQARQGDAGALEMLAEMALTGEVVHRDLALSRDLYAKAARVGSVSAAAIHRAFVANGTGGPRDWTHAIRLLRDASSTDPQAAEDLAIIADMSVDPDGQPTEPFVFEQMSTSPDVKLFRGLLSAGECNFLVRRSTPRMQPSLVVDPLTGEQVPNPVRTSHAAFFPLMAESPAIHALNRRLAAASGTKVEQGEPLQVLRYSPGQEYRPHLDAIADIDNQRILTFLVYLNDDYGGGETEFLAAGLKVKGAKGDGLLFRNADVAARPDPRAKHAGLLVDSGEKYLASRWIRERPMALA